MPGRNARRGRCGTRKAGRAQAVVLAEGLFAAGNVVALHPAIPGAEAAS